MRLIGALLMLTAAAAAQPYAIGHVSRSYTDTGRGGRAVTVEVYYPAVSGGSGTAVAGPAGQQYPVVVCGHGFTMPATRYTWLSDALATVGFIVALPTTETSLFPSHSAFGLDLAFVVAQLRLEGTTGASLFFGRVAPTAAVGGHSMGGGASFLAAQADPTIDAIFNLAAAETNPSAISAAAAITAPGLIFSGSQDCIASSSGHQAPMYAALASSCKAHVTITGGTHCQFAASDFNCNTGEVFSGCATGGVTRTQQQQTVQLLLTPWLQWVLAGDATALATYQSQLAAPSGFTYVESCPMTPAPTCGDCDLDGDIDVLDALLASRHDVGAITLTGPAFDQCDVNSSAVVTVLDALRIAQSAAGLPVALVCR